MVSRYTFKNGLRLVYEKPISVLPVTSVQVFCDYGSIYENDDVRGAAHFIEHMCFKGTSKIPDAKDIFLNYNKIGAYFNAETDKRYTRYYVLCEDDYVKNSIYILSDMLMNSTFNKKEFQKEREHVMALEKELKAHEKTDMTHAHPRHSPSAGIKQPQAGIPSLRKG
jgi:predicted Zn-dependent peptidase